MINYTVTELLEGDQMIREACHRCAKCCTRQVVIFTKKEWSKIAEVHNQSPAALALNTRAVPIPTEEATEYRLMAYPCPFLDGKECTIYIIRPQICRQYPFGKAITEALQGNQGKLNHRCPIVKQWTKKIREQRK